jgi:capsular polysaccharide transport system permease protein
MENTPSTPFIEGSLSPQQRRSTSTGSRYRKSMPEALREKRNVMEAVILRDLRSRYFNHGLGFLLVPLWSFAHLIFMLVVYQIIGRDTPYGDDIYLFFATGLLPTLMFMYTSRFMALSTLENKPMLSFPVVRLMDIILARAFLEIMAALLSALFVFCALLAIGSDPFPHNPFDALMAFTVTALFAVGAGIMVSCAVIKLPLFAMVWALVGVVLYLLSGTIFLLTDLPVQVATILAYNPLVHSVDWMRSAFYHGYPTPYLDKYYLIFCAVLSVFLGFLCERVFRSSMLSS